MVNAVKKTRKPRKRCVFRKGILRAEVWPEFQGKVVNYNPAFINHSLWVEDNGQVLGYDHSHGHHRRHYAGAEVKFTFVSAKLVERFLNEVRKLREKREPI